MKLLKQQLRIKVFFSGLLIICLSFVLSSCKVIFTQDIKNQIEEQSIDISDIQFYNSKKIILQRVDTSIISKEKSSKIQTEENIVLEKLIIKKNRPAICDSVTFEGLFIRFETGAENYLVFVSEDTTKEKSRYVIGAQYWTGELGMTPYGGQKYYIQPKSVDSYLKIKKKFVKNFLINKRKVKGLKVSDN